jgi:excisionase family DNA binding protein
MRDTLTQKMRAKGYITPKQAATRAQVPLSTLYTWLYENRVKSKKIRSARFVHEDSLKEYLR